MLFTMVQCKQELNIHYKSIRIYQQLHQLGKTKKKNQRLSQLVKFFHHQRGQKDECQSSKVQRERTFQDLAVLRLKSDTYYSVSVTCSSRFLKLLKLRLKHHWQILAQESKHFCSLSCESVSLLVQDGGDCAEKPFTFTFNIFEGPTNCMGHLWQELFPL